MRIYMCVYARVFIRIYMCMRVCIGMHMCVCLCVFMWMCISMCVYIRVRYVYICMYIIVRTSALELPTSAMEARACLLREERVTCCWGINRVGDRYTCRVLKESLIYKAFTYNRHWNNNLLKYY
ncbi:hypothetical protein B484DRAFT_341699 [Ochromonadaceae sp. CCMP2298]|nr:hypothetical protein B484DRAFT_341699 [Ochromonadaceae sp. CCMP2298]